MQLNRMVRAAVMVAVCGVWLPAAGCNKPEPVETPMVPEFERRLNIYLDVQKRATAELPALKRTDDPVEITSREVAMGSAVRAARANAKQGDVMSPEIAGYFRRLIKEDLSSRTPEEQKLMKDEIPNFPPAVNQTYPSDHPLATFPATLLKVMPTLPEGLEYRFVAGALIIRDIKVNLIVDFIPDVL